MWKSRMRERLKIPELVVEFLNEAFQSRTNLQFSKQHLWTCPCNNLLIYERKARNSHFDLFFFKLTNAKL